MPPPTETILMVLLGSLAGGFINGLAGFGTALFALGFFLSVMPPIQAVAVVAVLSVASSLRGLWLVRSTMRTQARRILLFVLPGIAGIPVGIAVLTFLDARTLKLAVAGFLLLYGSYFIMRRSLPQVDYPVRALDAMVGLLGGILGGAASLSGALPTLWCSMRPWSKVEIRCVLQSFNAVILGTTAAALWLRGAIAPDTPILLVIAVPTALLSSQLGIAAFARIPEQHFRRLLVGLCLLAGIALLLREIA